MKIVDIADEIHRELGSPSDLSIPAIAFYVRTNIGALNNHLNTSFDVDSTSFEIEESGTAITPEEVAIMKKMYLVHYYDGKLRDTINAATSDAVIALSSDGSSIRKINKNEQSKTFLQIRQGHYSELESLITAYKTRGSAPLQVAGDDTVAAVYRPNRDYNRI
tara:strand:+ start:462 stop:950 length:489 start_codon:yes stop_codon:yes gene_type:complete